MDLAPFKLLLERHKAELEQQIGLEGALAPGEMPVSEVETSPADKATVRLLNDLVLNAVGHNAERLRQLKHALAKIDNGSYGLCESCGEEIGHSRLLARPEASLCIACQTKAEKH